MNDGTPIGPGFFIFFQHEEGGGSGRKVEFPVDDEDDILTITKAIFTFLYEQD